jgi:hypothetical protein
MLAVELSTSPTLTYTAQFSPDNPEDGNFGTAAATYCNSADWRSIDGLTALAATDESNINFPVEAVRLNITTNTVGTATFKVRQAT